MVSIGFCAFAFAICFLCGRRSLAWGLSALMLVGYGYGILRANYSDSASHFIFDSGVVGLYLGVWTLSFDAEQRVRVNMLWRWVIPLAAWPLLLFLIPIQDPLVQLVGLRGVTFFLPAILIGALITDEDLYIFAVNLAALNLGAVGFAVAEYFMGLTPFFPHNPVTKLLYLQTDVIAGANDIYRLPATFPTPAGYGSAMVLTLPLLIGAWLQPERDPRKRYVLLAGMFASIVGVFLCASRTNAAFLLMILILLTLSGQLPIKKYVAWVVIIAGVAWLVSNSPRMQRFTELEDASMVEGRVRGSVNEHFFDLAAQYPLGNGLGAGGTSIPYFLQDRLRDPVAMENEYARIMLEEGIPGLLIWLAFIGWSLFQGAGPPGPWRLTRRMTWFLIFAYFGTAGTGTGLLTAIPNAFLLLYITGWYAVAPRISAPETARLEGMPSASQWLRMYSR